MQRAHPRTQPAFGRARIVVERAVDLVLPEAVGTDRAQQDPSQRGAGPPAAGGCARRRARPEKSDSAPVLRQRRPVAAIKAPGDAAQARLRGAARHLERVTSAQIGGRPGADLACGLRLVEDPAHQLRRVRDVRLGPPPLRWVGRGALADRDQREVDGEAVRRRHVIHVPRVAGGDHRLAEVHRLRDHQAEPLRAVQGHVAVATRHQAVAVGDLEVVVEEDDVRSAVRRCEHLGVITREALRVDALHHEDRALALAERGTEGAHRAHRVLAPGCAVVVVDAEEGEPLRPLELPGLQRLRRGNDHGHRDVDDRHRRRRGECLSDEARARPDLIDVGECTVVLLGEGVGLPPPEADVVAILEEPLADVAREVRHSVGIDADEVHRERRPVGVQRGERVPLPAVRCVQLHRSHGDADGVEGRDHPARDLSDPELPAQVARDIHAGNGVTADLRRRPRGGALGCGLWRHEHIRDRQLGGTVRRDPAQEAARARLVGEVRKGVAQIAALKPDALQQPRDARCSGSALVEPGDELGLTGRREDRSRQRPVGAAIAVRGAQQRGQRHP
ncbi:unannotated protein [freshwater metagenome]|uniref:Unannotated protein n=1 Tax=freshwater metagenome TaxID=449393 RepID=A0A6J7DYA7_9ZZZZ